MSTDNLCKLFGPRSGKKKCQAWSDTNLFDTLMVFFRIFFGKVNFEKHQQTIKKNMQNYTAWKELNFASDLMPWRKFWKSIMHKDFAWNRKCILLGAKHSYAGEAPTCNPSVSSQALYHWATALPILNDVSYICWSYWYLSNRFVDNLTASSEDPGEFATKP